MITLEEALEKAKAAITAFYGRTLEGLDLIKQLSK